MGGAVFNYRVPKSMGSFAWIFAILDFRIFEIFHTENKNVFIQFDFKKPKNIAAVHGYA